LLVVSCSWFMPIRVMRVDRLFRCMDKSIHAHHTKGIDH